MTQRAILGGTFDPIHQGHLRLAEAALQQSSLKQVIWVPTANPRYKANQPPTDFVHRVAMLEKAIAPYPDFCLSTVETQIPPPAFAIQTLSALQKLYPATQWSWIVGLDTWLTLPRWYQAAQLAPQCYWLIAPRSLLSSSPGSVLDLCQSVADHFAHQGITLCWKLLSLPPLDISSQAVRQACRDRQSIEHLVPPTVAAYIATHQLYAASS